MKINHLFIASVFLFTCSIGLNSCTKDSAGGANSSAGKGGSLARFTITGNYLYAVDNHFLYAYSLANPARPEKMFSSPVHFDIETVYAYNKYLFLGSKTGLYIYAIDTAAKPRLVGEASHARACDPVVANDSVAFVTLKGWGSCGPAVSGLYVHDIRDIQKPLLRKTIELPDPVGLGLQDSILYVCCGSAGLKVFNVTEPFSPTLLSTKTGGNFIDVIPYNGLLVCFIKEGVLLYDIANPALPVLIKTIAN
jgi:hypothetical protein